MTRKFIENFKKFKDDHIEVDKKVDLKFKKLNDDRIKVDKKVRGINPVSHIKHTTFLINYLINWNGSSILISKIERSSSMSTEILFLCDHGEIFIWFQS